MYEPEQQLDHAAVEAGEHHEAVSGTPDLGKEFPGGEEALRRREANRLETLGRRRIWRARTALEMHQKGAVIGAIADRLRTSDAVVRQVLLDEGVKLHPWIDTTQYSDDVPELRASDVRRVALRAEEVAS